MKIVYADEAVREINAAVDYLIDKTGQLSIVAGLQADIRAAEELILQFPGASPPLGGGMRRCLLTRHAYQLVYKIDGDIVRVFAFAHLSRRPNYWRKRVT